MHWQFGTVLMMVNVTHCRQTQELPCLKKGHIVIDPHNRNARSAKIIPALVSRKQ